MNHTRNKRYTGEPQTSQKFTKSSPKQVKNEPKVAQTSQKFNKRSPKQVKNEPKVAQTSRK